MAEYIEREAVFKQFDNGEADVVEIYPELSILKNTIQQMASDADDKGEKSFGLRLTVEDAFTLCKLEPVVRCRDCANLYGSMCTACGLLLRKPDDFCSRGERKDGADSDADGSV